MRFALPTRSPTTPRPREPMPDAEPELDGPPPPPPRPLWRTRRWRPSRRQALISASAAGTAVLLLFFFLGLGTDSEEVVVSAPPEADSRPAVAAPPKAGGTGLTARERADLAAARKLAAAKAADEKAAAERAAKAKAARAAADRTQVVAMPALVGLKLNVAMDLAADAGLTAIEVCRTPGGDTPLWWSNWRITGQDVPAGTRISAAREICVAATK